MKIILKKSLTPVSLSFVERELKINSKMSNNFVNKCYAVFFSQNAIHLLLEYCPGKNLYEIQR
jgi:serine/threonine protein kinase